VRPLPDVTPAPPSADAVLPWDTPVADAVAELARARLEAGDTFLLDSGGRRHLFLFSPEGVRSFYAVPEAQASKGVADWQMLRRKLPDELFEGRRTFPHDAFGRDDVARYLTALDGALDVALDELADHDEVDVFAWTRRLAHRMALASWAGEPPQAGARFEQLVALLDALDASAAFVHPEQMAAVAADEKREERAALAGLEALLAENVRAHDAGRTDPSGTFAEIVARWDGEAEPVRSEGIARDVVLVHLGAMSNLFAALGWTIVHVLEHPDVRARLAAGEAGLAERCAMESTRVAQRSIMLRAVLSPTEVTDEQATYRVEPGVVLATLLPLTNRSAAPGLEHWDPDRWDRRRLRDADRLPARELVTTFGHGSHTCPAQPFSLTAMSRTLERLLATYDLERRWPEPARPRPGQIGGVARSAEPCPVHATRATIEA
jgi:cytochrome P450